MQLDPDLKMILSSRWYPEQTESSGLIISTLSAPFSSRLTTVTSGDFIPIIQSDQFNSLSRSTHDPKICHISIRIMMPLVVVNDQIICISDRFYSYRSTGFIMIFKCTDSPFSAVRYTIIFKIRSFTKSQFRNRQDGSVLVIWSTQIMPITSSLIRVEFHTADAGGGTSHGSYPWFVKPGWRVLACWLSGSPYFPVVSLASNSSSPSLMVIALMPLARGRRIPPTRFLIVPCLSTQYDVVMVNIGLIRKIFDRKWMPVLCHLG